MSLPVSNPVAPLQSSSLQDLPFRLNERVNAQVLQVSGPQVVLEINGYPIVARLNSKDQASELLSRRSADFIITQLSRDEITLKFVNKTPNADNQSIQGVTKDPVPDISKWLGLEGTENETALIRAALQEKLPVTKEMVNHLLQVVIDSGIDVTKGIELAVKLKAAGLPVTSSSLEIVNQFHEMQLAEDFAGLIKDLRNVLTKINGDHPLASQIQNVLTQLEMMIPDLSANEDKIKACIQELFQFIGKPYEKLLNEQMNSTSAADESSFNLLTLLQLGKDLRQGGQTKAADQVDHFLEQVRQNQFMNIKAESTPGKGTWGEINFIVQQQADRKNQTSDAKIRISYRQDKHPGVIDPKFTSLILQVDLEPSKEVVFGISLFQNKMNVDISSCEPEVKEMFSDALPDFVSLMNHLGYFVVQTNVHLNMKEIDQKTESSLVANLDDAGVDIKV